MTTSKHLLKNQREFKPVARKINLNGLITHHNEHPDEFVSFWLLKKFGHLKFLNIEKIFEDLKIEHVDADNYIGEDALTGEEMLFEKGILAIGIGGGIFDEHPSHAGDRKTGCCSATLVAKYLGVANYPELKKIIAYVESNDLKGQSSFLDLAHQIRLMQDAKWAFRKIMIKVFDVIDLIYDEQRQFHHIIGGEVKNKAKRFGVDIDGREIKIAVIETDMEKVDRYLRSSLGGSYSVVVQKNSNGNVQIFSNAKFGLTFRGVVSAIRKREFEITFNKTDVETSEDCEAEGVKLVTNWFYQKSGEMILNGSRSALEKRPTSIPLDELIQLVRKNVAFAKKAEKLPLI